MYDVKTKRISVRVSGQLLDVCTKKGVNISYVCRKALIIACNQLENVPDLDKKGENLGKLHSKEHAARLFNELKKHLGTISTGKLTQDLADFERKIAKMSYKSPYFFHFYLPRVEDKGLLLLQALTEQGPYLEEVLQLAYKTEEII